ncbi:MAG: hypothetical protein H7Z14_11315, partial [Anaerolineae bacterium]|nr:hypothetical protein [Phycisphaerae bacterium]
MLLNSLDALRRKVKVLGVAYGVGIALAVAVIGLLGASILDYLLNLPAAPRIFVSLVVLGAIAHVLWWYLINPAMKRVSLSDMAGKLETAFPQFDDRLRSTVNFLGGPIPGSDAMKDRVVGETTTLASRLDLSRAVVTAPAWYSLAAGIGAVGFLFLLATYVINPTYRNIALARLFMPFADNAWPKRVQIDLVGQLPQRIPVGQRLDVRMKLGKGDRESMKAIVYYQYDGGAVMQEFMTRGADGTYSASLDTRVESGKASTAMKVWMRAGDDERQVGAVTVVPRLTIKSVEAVISPPEYVQPQQTSTVNLSAAPAVMAVGSKVAVRITFNKPLDAGVEPEIVSLEEAGKAAAAPKIAWSRDGNLSAVGSWVATNSLRFRVRGTDTDQFSNSALEEYELIVRPDQTPTVQIENPRRSEERTPVAVIPVQAVAEDDYGVTSLKLVVDRLGDKRHWEIPLVESASPVSGINWNRAEATGDRLRFRVNHDWDLSKLEKADLKSGDVLEYYLLVTDNFLLNGQRHEPVPSGKLRIAIISQDDLTNRVIDDLRKIKEQIGATKNNQTRTKQQTENLKNDTKDKPDLDAADRAAAERLTNQQSNAAAQAMALSTRLQNLQKTLDENKSPSNDLRDLARDVKNDLDRAADGPMKQAGQDLQNVVQPNQPKDKRDAALDDAQKEQTKATDQLQQAMDRMANIGSLAQTIERIAEILKDQKDVTKQTADAGHDNLGKRPEEMKPEDRKKLEEAADAQAKLAERTGKAMDEMQKMAEQMKRSDPSAADAMEKAQQTSKQQNVQKSQQQAAQNAKQNQQAPAQSAQRQAELGLEMMLNQLREAERNRLAELSKKLEEL